MESPIRAWICTDAFGTWFSRDQPNIGVADGEGLICIDAKPLYEIPDGWMLVPKQRGTVPLADLIQITSLACVENRLLDDDDRREFAEYADLIRNNGVPHKV